MFTGIIVETGTVESIVKTPRAIEMVVRVKVCARGLKRGDSVAVNGCCLTAVKIVRSGRQAQVQFDLLQETWQRTNLQFLKPGSLVNLEPALRADSRMGGHFVTGHIDGVGRILCWEKVGEDHRLEVAVPPDVLRYVVFKGSIAVDGISLTVASVRKSRLTIWIIPHTCAATNLQQRAVGDAVNLEADILAKYVEQLGRKNLVRPRRGTQKNLKTRGQ